MKNILVATDFSNAAYSALFYATKLLAAKPCTFYILNVFDETTPLNGKRAALLFIKKRLPALHIQSKEKLTETFHRISMDTENTHHSFLTISKKGSLEKSVKEIIADYNVDLVVMGSKGLTGAKEIFLGSNTIQVAQGLALCPVLAVPKQIDYKSPKEIAFITDFKKGCVKETLAPLLYLAALFESNIRVMHIAEEEVLDNEQEIGRKELDACLKSIDHSFHWVQNYDDKAMVITSFLEKQHVDMFVMLSHKRSFFEKLIREPVIQDVIIYSSIPFLILPE